MPRVKYMNKELKEKYNLDQYGNFSITGSIQGIKDRYYGQNVLLVRSGSYIYKVPLEIYQKAR